MYYLSPTLQPKKIAKCRSNLVVFRSRTSGETKMLSATTFNLSNIQTPSPQSPHPNTSPNPIQTTNPSKISLPTPQAKPATTPGFDPPPARKLKPSPQLNRWSRARSIRSGRKLDHPSNSATTTHAAAEVLSNSQSFGEGGVLSADEEDDGDLNGGKGIYIVSDGTGWTAENSVNAALGQFEHCLVDRGCAVTTHLFSGIEDVELLMDLVRQAAQAGAMIVYTLADPSMAEAARKACKLWGVPSTDVLGPITEAIASHLGVSPLGLPRGAPGRNPLTDEYFRRIEAIEFTIKQDDGALPQNLDKADIVLTGVSRTGKTPLSIYLAQKAYKVANVPIVMGLEVPKTLFEIDPKKVFGLTINPVVLQTIRKARAKTLGFDDESGSSYAGMDHVRKELEYAGKIFAQNPTWPVIEVTGKAIEETAAVVLRLYQDRKYKCSMPGISRRY